MALKVVEEVDHDVGLFEPFVELLDSTVLDELRIVIVFHARVQEIVPVSQSVT